MVFADYFFLIWFLPPFFLLYFLVPRSGKNIIALAGSLFFYSWGEPLFILVLIGSLLFDYFFLGEMYKRQGSKCLLYLIVSICVSVGLLIWFKYFSALFTGETDSFLFRTALPLGISFFTFQKLSYALDLYRKKAQPAQNLINYGLYVLFFPQLIMGPIVRYQDIARQIKDRQARETFDNRLAGFFRFIIGLSRKVLIANPLWIEVDKIFALTPEHLSTEIAWIGLFAFAFYIYMDFGAYADMAIGLGRMAGFSLPENFRNPYISTGLNEFWRRWHITLGTWMRDYVYAGLRSLPNGRNRRFLNLWVVFLLTALWHGSGLNFLIWGVYNGFFMTLELLFINKALDRAGKIPGVLYGFGILLLGMVLFQSRDPQHALSYYEALFGLNAATSDLSSWQLGLELNSYFGLVMALAAFFSFWALIPGVERWQRKFLAFRFENLKMLFWAAVASLLLIFCLAELASAGFQPFLYENF